MDKKIAAITLAVILATPSLVYAGRIHLKQYEVERTDQDLSGGNRGFIYGTPPPAPEQTEAPKRTMLNLEIELPPYPEWDEKKQKKEAPKKEEGATLEGNRGYVAGGIEQPAPAAQSAEIGQGMAIEAPVMPETKKESGLPTTYKVKKGDTLQSISAKPEIYNSEAKWTKIYKANKDKLENPNKIYPGQLLVIPREE